MINELLAVFVLGQEDIRRPNLLRTYGEDTWEIPFVSAQHGRWAIVRDDRGGNAYLGTFDGRNFKPRKSWFLREGPQDGLDDRLRCTKFWFVLEMAGKLADYSKVLDHKMRECLSFYGKVDEYGSCDRPDTVVMLVKTETPVVIYLSKNVGFVRAVDNRTTSVRLIHGKLVFSITRRDSVQETKARLLSEFFNKSHRLSASAPREL